MKAKSPTLLLIVATCHGLFFPYMAVAASRTLKAGDVLGVSEHLILSGDDVLDVRGTAAKPCRIDANGQQIKTTADWRGWIKVNHCEFRSLGSDKLAALDLASIGQGDKIIIENSAFHACGAIHLANHDNSSTIFRNNILHANSMVPVTNLPNESPPGFRATGRSPARKLFQGNHVFRSIVLFENTGNWLIGGDTPADANLLIGMRASLSIYGASDMRLCGNYIHTEIPSFRWSQVHALAVNAACPGLVVEHNVIRHGQWVVRGLTGEFRYNLVLDADAHNFIVGPAGKCHIHHNIFARYCTVDPNLNSSIAVIYKADDIQIYNNTFDGGGNEMARRWHVPAIEVGANGFLASLRNNVFFNHPTRFSSGTATIRPGFSEKQTTPGPPRLGFADFNLFYNPDAAEKRNYALSVAGKTERADAGFAKNDLPVRGDKDAQMAPKFKGPIPDQFPFADADLVAGKVTVPQLLAYYREVYSPGPESPLLGAGDPADGPRSYIGAVGGGLDTPNDFFGQHIVKQAANTWLKRSPIKGGPVSPGLGYECSLVYDPVAHRVIRWAGHNQGGGGEQNGETWTLDPVTMKWELKEPNRSPPGACCNQQNVFDLTSNRFLRFPAFSGSHGWHWFRENYLNNTSVWAYDHSENTWRDLRPVPAPHPSPLRCASWDSHHQVVVIFGGEGSTDGTIVYDPYQNTWTRMRPAVEPASRSGGNMAYDAARRVHVLFGSQFTDDPHTWTYDLAKNEWRDMEPAIQPPTNRNDAVLAYDQANKVVVAVVRAVDQFEGMEAVKGHIETWAYDAGKNKWEHRKPTREPDGWGNRRRVVTAIPDQQMLLMEAYVNPSERIPGVDREQQIWTYRYGEVQSATTPPPPTSLTVTTQTGKAMLSWKESPGAKGYKLYRGEGNVPWTVSFKEIAQLRGSQTSYTDLSLATGVVYYYDLRLVVPDNKTSDDAARVRTQPRLVEDVLVSVRSPREVRLTWKAPQGDDIVGYYVERAVVEVFSEDELLRLKKDTAPLLEPSVGAIKTISSFVRLTKEPIASANFTDKDVDLNNSRAVPGEPVLANRFRADQIDPNGKPYRYAVYAYRVRAVNMLGVEGGSSPYFLTIPSAPQWLFTRENGAQCQLKWAANAEVGLQGYRVYRMEGPRVNGPGQKVTRLTADPVLGTQYTDTDTGAGQDTRRYWVVAVDALGQEGLPSAPAWHYRQYRKLYEPFVGDWHQ